MANPNPNTSGLRRGFTPEQRAKSIETRKLKADKKYDAYLTGLEEGKRPSVAAREVGLTAEALRTRRDRDPAFIVREREAEAIGSEPVEAALREAALNGNVQAAKEWLERRSEERWAEKPKVVKHETVIGIEAGPRLERIAALLARLEDRRALNAGEDVIDV
jgi:hypothetical protein